MSSFQHCFVPFTASDGSRSFNSHHASTASSFGEPQCRSSTGTRSATASQQSSVVSHVSINRSLPELIIIDGIPAEHDVLCINDETDTATLFEFHPSPRSAPLAPSQSAQPAEPVVLDLAEDDDDDLEFLGHCRDPQTAQPASNALATSPSFWQSFYALLLGNITPMPSAVPISTLPAQSYSFFASDSTTESAQSSSSPSAEHIVTSTTPHSTPPAVPTAVHPQNNPPGVILHPDDPAVTVDALMSKLSCPICYRAFRRKKVMTTYAQQLKIRKSAMRKMDVLALEEARRCIDLMLKELTEPAEPSSSRAPNGDGRRKKRPLPSSEPTATPAASSTSSLASFSLADQNGNLGLGKKKRHKVHDSETDLLLPDQTAFAQEPEPFHTDPLESQADVISSDHETTELRVGRCGHVYCDRCIRKYVSLKKKCPVCNQSLLARQLYPLFL